MSIPQSIRDDAFELEGESQSFLYDLYLRGGAAFHLSPVGTHTWQGREYDEVPCHLSASGKQAEGKRTRPKFSVVNPKGIFTPAVNEGTLENATLIRHRINRSDLLAGRSVSLTETFRITRVVQVNEDMIVVECRGALDGANFKLPNRVFIPPEFEHVSL